MTTIASNIQQVRARVAAACALGQRPVQSVTLLAVSKHHSAHAVRQAVACGQLHFGENYVQEALDKMAELADIRSQLTWHLIGPLQSNKTRAVAEQFDWVHTIDRLKIAERLSEQRPTYLPALQVCIQVNISAQVSKSGVAVQEVLSLAAEVAQQPNLKLRGLMALPDPTLMLAEQQQAHQKLHQLLGTMQAHGLDVDTLSMGMSADLEAAVLEGATMIRIGTAIFGAR